jgi:hypothetical protein
MASSKPSTNQDISNNNQINDGSSSEETTNKNTRKRRRTTSTVLNTSKTNIIYELVNEENLSKKPKIIPVIKRGRGRPPKNSTANCKTTLKSKLTAKNRQQQSIKQKLLSPPSSKPKIQTEKKESNEIQIIIPVDKQIENKDVPCTSLTRDDLVPQNKDNDSIINEIETSLLTTARTSSNIEYKSISAKSIFILPIA